MRTTVVAVVAALLSAVLFAVTGKASTASGRFLTANPGDFVKFNGLDLSCKVFASDPDHHEAGPVLFCGRNSVRGGGSRSVSISRYHIGVSDESGNYVIYQVGRTP